MVTLWRLLFILVSIPIAWHYGPALLRSLVWLFPAFAGAGAWLVPDFTGRDALFYAQFALSLVIVWLLVVWAVMLLGFMLPQAARFSNTKPLRRVQGAAFEVVFLVLLMLVPTFAAMATGIGQGEARQRYEAFHAEPLPVGKPEPKLDPLVLDEFGKIDPLAPTQRSYDGVPPQTGPPDIAPRQRTYDGEPTESAAPEIGSPMHASPLQWTYFTMLANWWWMLPLALVADVTAGKRLKFAVSRVYTRILRFVESGRFGFGGSARFAALVEEWPLRWRMASSSKTTELFMGRSLYNGFLHVSLKDDRHMLTIAGSRTGKGSTAIIPNLLTWEGSCVVIDPKGTNAAVTAGRRRAMGHDVFVVDPFNAVTGHLGMPASDGFNPLDAIDLTAANVREQLGVLAEALVVRETDSKQRHWDDGAKTIIRGLLTHLMTAPEFKGRTSLPTLREMLTLLGDEQLKLWADMARNKAAGGGARDAGARIINGIDTDEIRNILSNAHKHTEWLSSEAMKDVLSRSTFNFRQLREKPTTIYLVLPFEVIEDHKRFLRLFINLAIMQMSRGGKSKIPVLMLLDEFLTLGHMSEVEKAFVFMAGYNLVVWPFAQDYGQLQELYGGAVSSFITNSRAVQVFGVSDPKTTEFVSGQIGRRSMKYVWGLDMMRSEPFRQPDEIAKEVSRDNGLQYILRAGKAPLILERVPYFEDQSMPKGTPDGVKKAYPFSGLYAPDPDHV